MESRVQPVEAHTPIPFRQLRSKSSAALID
jgi:hypothetical protein